MTDRKIVLAVVVTLGFLAVTSLVGIVMLAVLEKPVPDVLQNVGIGSMSAVAALLAKTSTSETQPVSVENPPSDPVMVETAPARRGRKVTG